MKETQKSPVFSLLFVLFASFVVSNARENDKMLRLLEQRDDSTALTKIALTPCTLSLCGENSCDIASMPRFGQQTQTWASWGIWGAGRRGRTKGFCAKQTQFWPRQGEGQVVCVK